MYARGEFLFVPRRCFAAAQGGS